MIDLDFVVSFLERLNSALKLDQYYIADWMYLAILLTAILCLYRGHRSGKIDLWTVITAHGKGTVVDGKKLFAAGAFVSATCWGAHMAIQGKMTEWFMVLYLSAFVAYKWAGDREQRLNRMIDSEKQVANEISAKAAT